MGQQSVELTEAVKGALREGAVDSVSLEASLIVARAAGAPDQREYALSLAEKRVSGIPMSYLLGEKEFMSLRISVDERVLIPRPETEILVEVAERCASVLGRPVTYVDVGTGSGNIPVALLVRNPEATAVCVDISRDALSVARENADDNGVLSRCRFVCGDLLASISESFRADIIVSNPPYISSLEFESLPCEVRDHEPRIALYGGHDGLDFFRRLAETVPEYLEDDGILAVEVGYRQAGAVKNICSSFGMSIIETVKDLAGIDRVVVAKKD